MSNNSNMAHMVLIKMIFPHSNKLLSRTHESINISCNVLYVDL